MGITDGVLLAGAAFRAAVRRFRVIAAFRAADVPINQLRRFQESSGWLTCRAQPRAVVRTASTRTRSRSPLASCSGMVGGAFVIFKKPLQIELHPDAERFDFSCWHADRGNFRIPPTFVTHSSLRLGGPWNT